MKNLFACVATLLLAGCATDAQSEYAAALSKEIESSDRIVITEHSFMLDAYDHEANKSLIPEDVVYRTVDLSKSQRAMFTSVVNGLDSKIKDAFTACVTEVHHTIYFYSQGKLRSAMYICFECGQIEWSGTEAPQPWSLYSGLHTVVKRVGLEPEREWHKLAEAYLKERATQTTAP